MGVRIGFLEFGSVLAAQNRRMSIMYVYLCVYLGLRVEIQ